MGPASTGSEHASDSSEMSSAAPARAVTAGELTSAAASGFYDRQSLNAWSVISRWLWTSETSFVREDPPILRRQPPSIISAQYTTRQSRFLCSHSSFAKLPAFLASPLQLFMTTTDNLCATILTTCMSRIIIRFIKIACIASF